MSRPELLREHGRGPCGLPGTAGDPEGSRVPKRTPGTQGIGDAAAPGVIYEDLNSKQRAEVAAAVRLARRRIGEAVAELKRAKEKVSPLVEAFFRFDGREEENHDKLDRILANYHIIAGALLGHDGLVIDGERTGPAFNLGKIIGKSPQGYVWSRTRPEPGETAEIQIVTPNFMSPPEVFDNLPRSVQWKVRREQARVVIHEVAHRYCGVDDIKYLHGKPGRLSVEEAMDNADSYASFAIPEVDYGKND